MEKSNISLADLAGIRTLAGCDTSIERINTWGDHFEDASCIRFCLDGVNYTAIEDPDDGYRSSLGALGVGGAITNTFSPITVECRHLHQKPRDWSDGFDQCDILECIDVVTGKVVLEVGTDCTDDYYPSFVSCFSPENMATNAGAA